MKQQKATTTALFHPQSGRHCPEHDLFWGQFLDTRIHVRFFACMDFRNTLAREGWFRPSYVYPLHRECLCVSFSMYVYCVIDERILFSKHRRILAWEGDHLQNYSNCGMMTIRERRGGTRRDKHETVGSIEFGPAQVRFGFPSSMLMPLSFCTVQRRRRRLCHLAFLRTASADAYLLRPCHLALIHRRVTPVDVVVCLTG